MEKKKYRRPKFFPVDPIVNALIKERPHFANLSDEIQRVLAEMIWSSVEKRKQHTVHENAVSISYLELDRKFSRSRFRHMNEELQLFERLSESYRIKGGTGHTAGWRLLPDIAEAVDQALDAVARNSVQLKYEDGRRVLKAPAPLPAKDMNNQTIKGWAGAKQLQHPHVDVVGLRRLLKYLEKKMTSPVEDLFYYMTNDGYLRRLSAIRRLIALASTDIAPGQVIHAYEQINSGRIYAQGPNLQNSPRVLKEVALYGMWEYDIANCHYAVFQQMASVVGVGTPCIAAYLANKKATRQNIADRVGINYEDAKECLLMVMYGAPANPFPDNAIPSAIGEDAAKRLFADPVFMGIADEIKRGRTAILAAQAVLTGQGGKQVIKNTKNLSIAADAPAAERLAHLIQGVEALMLDTMTTVHADAVALMQHDGFASTRRLDRAQLCRLVFERTGYDIELEETQIYTSADLGSPRQPQTLKPI